MIQALFDERRRAEIRDALKSGRRIEFRRKPAPMGGFRLDISEEELARMGHEERGREVPRYVRGMNLSDADRIVGGDLVHCVNFIGRDDLDVEFVRIRSSDNPDHWHPFIDRVRKWAGEGGDADARKATLSAILWHYTAATGDNAYWKVGQP